jgi:hypothetical protein
MEREKLINLSKEETLDFFRRIGINEDYIDLILAEEDTAYDKQVDMLEEMFAIYVGKTNKMWDEIVEEKGHFMSKSFRAS